MELKRILFIPDVHVPYHDSHAFELMLQVAKAVKFDRVVVMGDFADFYSVSAHDKDPRRKSSLQWEIEAVNEALDRIDALKIPDKEFIEGNHENRLERYLMTRAPELFESVRVRDLFRLDERGWGFTPYKHHKKIGKLNLTHDCGNAGPDAHRRAGARFNECVAIGHTHQMAVGYMGDIKGNTKVTAMFGWLGDRTKIDYMHQVGMDNWQLGFGLGYLYPDGQIRLHACPIVEGRVEVEGRNYELKQYRRASGEYVYKLAS